VLTTWQTCFAGATVRNCYAGAAAALGITATTLTAAGSAEPTAPAEIFGELAGEVIDKSIVSSDSPAIVSNYLKFHSACALTHAAIDAALDVREEHVGEIRAIRVETVSNNLKVAREPAPTPLSRRFSLPYAVAIALTRGKADIDAFDAIESDATRLAALVQVVADPDLDVLWPQAAPVKLVVQGTRGEARAYVENPRGHYLNPASPDEIRRKFDSLVLDEGSISFDRLLNIDHIDNVARLFS
jgi:2-methylcitrate dehydratase PrpD